jgi:hypothetical protein
MNGTVKGLFPYPRKRQKVRRWEVEKVRQICGASRLFSKRLRRASFLTLLPSYLLTLCLSKRGCPVGLFIKNDAVWMKRFRTPGKAEEKKMRG